MPLQTQRAPTRAPIDFLSDFMRGNAPANDPLKLAALRDNRTGEAEDRLVQDLRAGRPEDLHDAQGTDLLLHFLQRDADQDPNTGVEAHKRVSATQDALGGAALRGRPEMVADQALHAKQVGDLEKSMNYGKTYGASTGAADAGVLPNEQFLGEQAHTRKVEELAAPNLAKGQVAAGGRGLIPGTNVQMPAKIGQRSSDTLRSIRELAPLIGQLENTITDPHDNSVANWAGNKLKYGLYKMGMSPDSVPGSTPQDQLRMQLAGLIKVLGASPYAASSRNFNFLKQAQEHLTDAGSTQAFLASQLKELKDILPRFQQEILVNESAAGTPLDFTEPGGAVYGGNGYPSVGSTAVDPNDPSTWPRVR